MATIRKGGKGWQALIRKKNHIGARSKTFASKAQAELWAKAFECSFENPKGLTERPPQILREAINSYIEGPLKTHRSGHNEKYPLQVTANSWLGGIPLNELSIRHLAIWRDERLLTVKANTVMRELRILRVLLDWAKDELGCELKSNPARALKVRDSCDARMPYLTKEEENQLIQALSQSRNPEHKKLTQLALATGMRRSELLSLKWADIDLDQGIARVNRKGCTAQGLSNSQRLIPLSQTTIKLLKGYQKCEEQVVKVSLPASRHAFNRAKKIAGLRDLHFHDLRHIAISRMWAEGMNAIEISAVSGHKDLRMLMRYSHYLPSK